MSNRTKSFFDQNHNNKPRQARWHQNHTRTPLNETNNNAAPQKPPIPATSETKSKLKAFQFVPGHPDDPRDAVDEENTAEAADTNEDDTMEDSALPNVEVAKENKSSSAPEETNTTRPVPQLPQAQTFPCTPGTRLPLEDLIGNFDDNAKKPEPQDQSPEEYLGWIPNSSSNLLTPGRKRKRARSSSPSGGDSSSQRRETSIFFAGPGEQLDIPAAEVDPSADLWQRYGVEKQSDAELKLPDFNHLIFQASPRALQTPAKGGGLRRWASTGNDWPTSKAKRRRVATKTNAEIWQDGQAAVGNEKNKFVDMLTRVEESLATQKLAKERVKPTVRIEGPSSSSPLPEIGAPDAFNGVTAVSPLQSRHMPVVAKAAVNQFQASSPKAAISAARQSSNNGRSISPSITYGPATDSGISAPLCLQRTAPLPAFKRPSITRTPSDSMHQKQTLQKSAPAASVATNDFEDFGDDLDLTAEDLEELMTQPPPLDQRPMHQIPAHPNPPPQQAFEASAPNVTGGDSAARPIQLDDDDDEFGMNDIDEASFAAAEISATQTYRISPRKRKSKSPKKTQIPAVSSNGKSTAGRKDPLKHLQRYTVKQVVESEYTDAKGRRRPEKILLSEEERTSRTVAITTRDSWVATSAPPGTIVHMSHVQQAPETAPPSSPPGQITVSDADDSPLLIIHPDHMLSATTVGESFDCMRRAVFKERVKATSDMNKSMVYGKILHEIFQQALWSNRWDDAFLADLVERTVQNYAESLWTLGMENSVLAVEEISAHMPELASWARIYVAEQPSEVAVADDKKGGQIRLSISKLIAIEEHIWSPRYGLKGNIDATVEATVIDPPNEPAKRLIAPFEVKTGKKRHVVSHMAQTALYTLLLSDRYDVNVKAGVLYYLETSDTTPIAPLMKELREMMQQRNRLAWYLHKARNLIDGDNRLSITTQSQEVEASVLPGMLKDTHVCGRCYAQQSCFTYHALAENGTANSAGMIDNGKTNHSLVWQEALGHLRLSAKDQSEADKLKQWFTKWDRLLTLEESESSRFRKELWTMDSTEREAAGRCFGGLIIHKNLTATPSGVTPFVVDGIEGSGGKIYRFAYTFAHPSRQAGHSFAHGSQLTVGETVVVSSEGGQWALANGYVTGTSKFDITIAVDRRLGSARQRQAHFDEQTNQAFAGIMTVGNDTTGASCLESPGLYRLDKDEYSNGLAKIRSNLLSLMSSHPIHTKLRKQIILDSEPAWQVSMMPDRLAPSQLGEMNEDQRGAVRKVLDAKDYALILGMPGTGKTTTIAHIIRALLASDQSILLSSFTHTAVDNILLKIQDVAPPNSILRVGVPAKINPQVREFCQLANTPRSTVEEVEEAYMCCRIVATTCMGANHALFNRRAFDVCIVDEASQITLPIILGPLLHARKFVLVGDHYQLPPLVQNKNALEGGLDVSLFRQLSEQQPGAVAMLGKQYRMCEDIMSLSNTLIYSGQLQCGNLEVGKRTLQIGSLDALSKFHNAIATCSTHSRVGTCWIQQLVQSERKVVFANTDGAGNGAMETLTSGKNITNQFEATLVAQLVLSLQATGIRASDIGVISLYRSQLSHIKQLFKKADISSDVAIDSVDRFQGRDKECIILSMVRSNEAGIVGDLLKDWRRVNVALTRARSKLILLGSRQTLRNNELLAKCLSIMHENAWTFDLPRDADTCHTFNFSSQAASEVLAESLSNSVKVKNSASPEKNTSPKGSHRASMASPREPLKDATQRVNQSPAKGTSLKKPAKVISGHASRLSTKSMKALEQAAFEIFEDINAEDL